MKPARVIEDTVSREMSAKDYPGKPLSTLHQLAHTALPWEFDHFMRRVI